MATLHIKRPEEKTHQRAWDYITKKYGTPDNMVFLYSCCYPGRWSAKIKNRLIIVTPEEIRKFEQKLGKI